MCRPSLMMRLQNVSLTRDTHPHVVWQTPLQLAIEHAHKGTVELLLYGHPRADINVLDADGNPLRESARRRGYDAMFDWV